MPYPSVVAWEAGRVAGWALTVAGGGVLLFAQDDAIHIPYVQNNAALGVTIAGLATLLIDRYYRDRADARASHARELEAKVAEMTARVHELEAAAHAPSAPLPIPEPKPEHEPEHGGSPTSCPPPPAPTA